MLERGEDGHLVIIEVDAQIAGSVSRIEKRVGDRVHDAEVLLLMESMKMEIPLLAPCAGRVLELRAEPGQIVAEGEVLVVLGD